MNGLRLACAVALALLAAGMPRAQIRTVDMARLDSMANPSLAAGAEAMAFARTDADTGTLRESDEPKSCIYRFRNTGSEPIAIIRTQTTCGCVMAEAKPKVVEAGDEGTIAVTYNPKGHAGKFTHRVFVYTQLSESRPTAVLTLRASVSAGEAPEGYPFNIGALWMKRNAVNFTAGDSAVETIEVFNAGDKPLDIGCNEKALPPCIGFACTPKRIEPRTAAILTIRYDAGKEVPGRASLTIPLMLTGTGQSGWQSTVRITVEER